MKRRHHIRADIHQAAWNSKHAGVYPFFCLFAAIVLGAMGKSWWLGLSVWVVLSALPHFKLTVGIASFFCGLAGMALGATILSAFGSGAAVVGGLVGYALTWVPMRASEQYWRDIESRGGPYSD